MKDADVILAIDLALEGLGKNDVAFATFTLVLLRARLIARKEDVKVNRKFGVQKKGLIDSIKKLKI